MKPNLPVLCLKLLWCEPSRFVEVWRKKQDLRVAVHLSLFIYRCSFIAAQVLLPFVKTT
jgi:hypothetical protein